MEKQGLINEISGNTGVKKITVAKTIEALMETIRHCMTKNQKVYLKGFGTFIVIKRAKKFGRNIKKNITVIIPEHFVPVFKPSKEFIVRSRSTES
jgi:DNA-binding protein HU-beta